MLIPLVDTGNYNDVYTVHTGKQNLLLLVAEMRRGTSDRYQMK